MVYIGLHCKGAPPVLLIPMDCDNHQVTKITTTRLLGWGIATQFVATKQCIVGFQNWNHRKNKLNITTL